MKYLFLLFVLVGCGSKEVQRHCVRTKFIQGIPAVEDDVFLKCSNGEIWMLIKEANAEP